MATGTPCSGPRSAPDAVERSAASAAASASSGRTSIRALRCGLTVSIRSRQLWTTLRDDTCRVLMPRASWVADQRHSSSDPPRAPSVIGVIGTLLERFRPEHVTPDSLQDLAESQGVCGTLPSDRDFQI